MPTTIDELKKQQLGYYDRIEDDASKGVNKNFDKHLFIAGRILQSAEMNEIQTTQQSQLKGIADALFKDGDIVRDARANVSTSGRITIEDGAIYLRGQVRGVKGNTLTIAQTGTVVVGVWLISDVVMDTDDTDLRDPASGTRGFNEPGAYRLRVQSQWGVQSDNVANAEFFPVYYVDDGQLRAKEPPPNLDAVTQAIARYDVDSNGSNYIVNGLRVIRLDDEADGTQVYSVAAGRARVNGFGISLNSARRVRFKPDINLKSISDEPFGAKAAPTAAEDPKANGRQRVNLRNTPLMRVSRVSIQKKTTVPMTRSLSGVTDRIPSSVGSINNIISITAGSKTYVSPTDWYFDATGNVGGSNVQQIVWVADQATPTQPKNAPAFGDSFNIEANVWNLSSAEDLDDDGFYLPASDVAVVADPNTNAVTVHIDYAYKLPRVDRMVITEEGSFKWITGIATDINPASPQVPSNLLSLCRVHQAWTSNKEDTYLINDGVRMVSMSNLEAMNSRMDDMTDMIAQINLISDINVRDASKKKGLFVDPFLNDSQRDSGQPQTLAVTGGCLQLAIKGDPLSPTPLAGTSGVTSIVSCDFDDEVVLGNTAKTGKMAVNPYMAFGRFPSQVTLTPQIDRWVETRTAWAGAETRYFTIMEYAPWTLGNVHGMTQTTGQVVTNELASSSTADLEYLRQIPVTFEIQGFLPNEQLTKVEFDGVDITASVLQN